MAEPHTLKIGDVVRHPDWPEGETRTIVEIRPWQVVGWRGKRQRYLKDHKTERVVLLDSRVRDTRVPEDLGDIEKFSEQWMEAGLEKVDAD